PVSEARKVLVLHQQEMERDAEQLFSAVLPGIFVDVPKSSPIAAGILIAASSRKGPDLYVLTDGRETRVWNMERGKLPDIETWTRGLSKIGYADDSLRNVHLHIIGFPLVAAGDQDASPERGIQIKELWDELRNFGASSVEFENDTSGAM